MSVVSWQYSYNGPVDPYPPQSGLKPIPPDGPDQYYMDSCPSCDGKGWFDHDPANDFAIKCNTCSGWGSVKVPNGFHLIADTGQS